MSIGTLALGIGATVAIFSVVHGVLLKPLTFESPERLVGLRYQAPGLGFDKVNQSPATYFTNRDEGRAFEDVGMWDNEQVSVTGLEEPEQVEGMYVTDGTLPLLRVQPLLGRTFTATHREREGPRNRRGPPVHLALPPIHPRHLSSLPVRSAEVFIGNFSYQGVPRLRPEATLLEANADICRMIPLAVAKFPRGLTLQNLQEARFGARVVPLMEDVGNVLWVLLGTVSLVLLIACANVANLFLVRAEGQKHELALRTALGADRMRLSRRMVESATE